MSTTDLNGSRDARGAAGPDDRPNLSGAPSLGGPEALDAMRDQAVSVLPAWGLDPGDWRVVDVVTGRLTGDLRPVIETGGEQYLVRRQPSGIGEGELTFRHAFLRHLRDEGLPVSLPRPRPSGATHAILADALFELLEWRPGHLFAPDDPQSPTTLAAASSMLGLLHQASAHFAGPAYRWPADRRPAAVAEAYLELLRHAAAHVALAPAVSATAIRAADSGADRLAPAAAALETLPSPPELHIHGDYRPHHLGFAENTVAGIYDFDAAHWARRLDELAYALICFAGVRDDETGWAAPLADDGLDIARAHDFLRAYGAVAPPAEGERELLGDALTLAFPIILVNGIAEDLVFADEYGGPPPEEAILPRLEWADAFWSWIDRYRDVLGETWASSSRP
jgi:Ser/Thr protein kinase RdoA (MazF antagonist)